MISKLEEVRLGIETFAVNSKEELEQFRLNYLSKKGLIGQLFDEFKQIPADQKRAVGAKLNELKQFAEMKFNGLNEQWLQEQQKDEFKGIDFSLDSRGELIGSRHPLRLVQEEIEDIFLRIGFTLTDGPEIEDDWHNFSALNFPPDHPARDMQDTFFIDDLMALRTHTSSIQVRAMESGQLPLRIISPGRVYRNEAVSARANSFFHQIEGLYIDKQVSMADLKEVLMYFAQEFFGKETKIRLRPSYFPFTEPSAEMDVTCFLCKGNGCNVCKHTGWLEVMGCGMIDPAVLQASGIDSTVYSGYAFGMGIERITMLRYGIKDLRMFFENDIRFLRQFSGLV